MKRLLVYDPPCGTHIDHACKEATALAINRKRNVRFKFNDIDLLATPDSSWKEVARTFNSESERRAKEYRESPEGRAAAAHRASEVERKQTAVKDLLYQLPVTLAGGKLDNAVEWVKRFTEPADDIAVTFDKKGVAQVFIAYGYRQNEYVGKPREWFNSRDRIGRYLIGQVISCLKNGMPPHPRSLFFCEKYFATSKTRKAPSDPNGNEKQLVAPGSPKSASDLISYNKGSAG